MRASGAVVGTASIGAAVVGVSAERTAAKASIARPGVRIISGVPIVVPRRSLVGKRLSGCARSYRIRTWSPTRRSFPPVGPDEWRETDPARRDVMIYDL
jgi:hypothetical protein